LLNLREQCLREAGFDDLFYNVKQAENTLALRMLPNILHEVDGLGFLSKRLHLLLSNALTGAFDLSL
jgi:type II pantothenate kinase